MNGLFDLGYGFDFGLSPDGSDNFVDDMVILDATTEKLMEEEQEKNPGDTDEIYKNFLDDY